MCAAWKEWMAMMDEKTAKLCISPDCSILEAIRVLDETHERIVLIVEGGR